MSLDFSNTIEVSDGYGVEILVVCQKSKWEKYTTQSKTNQDRIMDFFGKFEYEDFSDIEGSSTKEIGR